MNKYDIAVKGKGYLKRYREIISILIKHGFGEFVSLTGIHKTLYVGKSILNKIQKKSTPAIHEYTIWERIRMVIEELGPTFIKFGQIMSNRPDLLPHQLITELEKLQDAVPAFDGNDAIKLVEKELGQPIKKVFSKFEVIPKASASISQVHYAVLSDGKEVAVKIQRPDIEDTISIDVKIMYHFALLLEKHVTGMDIINPAGAIKEFERVIKKELNFLIEFSYLERFAEHFKNNSTIYVPEVFKEHSTKRVLVMEYIHGDRLNDVIKKKTKNKYDNKLIAKEGAELYLLQIFRYGFFHGDPHPGNILVLPDNKLCFLDFGMVGIVPDFYKDIFVDLMLAITSKDYKKTTRLFLKLSNNPTYTEIDILEMKIRELIEQYYYMPIKHIDIGGIINQFVELLVSHKIRIPSHLYLLIKTFIIIEGFARQLDPDFLIVEFAKPYAKKLIYEKYSITNIVKGLGYSALDLKDMVKTFPLDLQDIIKIAKEGKVTIKYEGQSLEAMRKTIYHVSNLLAFSVVLAAVLMGSALVLHAGIPPLYKGIPLIGIIGFITSGILAGGMLFSVIKNRFK